MMHAVVCPKDAGRCNAVVVAKFPMLMKTRCMAMQADESAVY